MRRLIFFLLLCPLFLHAQDSDYLVFETTTLTPSPDKVLQFEALVAAHNKTFHTPGKYGVRVYSIVGGVDAGKYNWVMGPAHWSDLDVRPSTPGHTQDWVGNVVPNLLPETPTVYWRLDAENSRFPKDFEISKLMVWYVDVARTGSQKIDGLLGKVHDVYVQKFPEDTYGVYHNELPNSSVGNDIAIIWFFGKYSWMSEDNKFNEKFEEVHGAGSWLPFLEEWMAATDGTEQELWEYREDLSSNGPKVMAADRQ